MAITRNSRKFCTCLSKVYKEIKTGVRIYSRKPYQTSVRVCTTKLKAVGPIYCTKIIKEGRKLRR